MEIKKRNIKHIFLDVGDTLLYLSIPPGIIYLSVLRKFGLIAPDHKDIELKEKFSSAWSKMNSVMNPDSRDRYNIHPGGQDGWWKELIQNFLESIHGNLDFEIVEDVYREIFQKFEDESLWRVEESFQDVLQFSREKEIPIGIISNWDYRLRGLLKRKGLLELFEPVIVSAEYGYEKPSYRIFEEAEKLSGCKPENLVYIGDKVELDYVTPNSRGWMAFVLGARKDNIPNLEKLSDLLKFIS